MCCFTAVCPMTRSGRLILSRVTTLPRLFNKKWAPGKTEPESMFLRVRLRFRIWPLHDPAFYPGGLALLSVALLLWQWFVAIRFPLHQRVDSASVFSPAVTILKPLKGCDEFTEACLRSWLEQEHRGSMQFLFGVTSPEDPVCELVHKLIKLFPGRDARLVICGEPKGANPKVSTLVELEKAASHPIIIVSDADVCVPRDFLSNVVAPLRQERWDW